MLKLKHRLKQVKDDNKVEKPTTTQTDTTSKQNKSTTNPSEKDRKDKKTNNLKR